LAKTKLKELGITKVDFVDAGANPDAHIKLFKHKEGATTSETSKGTIGIALRKFLNIFSGLSDEDLESVAKGEAVTFGEKMYEIKRRKITEEIWDVCWALQNSLSSIITDEGVEQEEIGNMMKQSLTEFTETMQSAISQWVVGSTISLSRSMNEIAVDKSYLLLVKSKIDELVEKTSEALQNNNLEGESEEMKIDKSKMTSAELAFYEDLEKRYSAEEQIIATVTAPIFEGVLKTGDTITSPNQTVISDEDIYKGLHPAVAAQMEEMRKSLEAAEERELTQIAKKYELIGKKAEELVVTLKSLKAAGGTAYNDMIFMLDQTLETVEKSGAFSEIGKSGGNGTGGAWAKIEKKADEIMKSEPTMGREAAIDLACQNNPDLVREYETEE